MSEETLAVPRRALMNYGARFPRRRRLKLFRSPAVPVGLFRRWIPGWLRLAIRPHLVAGIEGDWSWANARGNITVVGALSQRRGGSGLRHQHELDAGLGIVDSCPRGLPRHANPDGLWHGRGSLGEDRLRRKQLRAGHSTSPIRHKHGILQHPGRLGGRGRPRMGD
jgi:hypothetical protein